MIIIILPAWVILDLERYLASQFCKSECSLSLMLSFQVQLYHDQGESILLTMNSFSHNC